MYRTFLLNEMKIIRSIDLPSGPLNKRTLDMNATVLIAAQPLHVTMDSNASVFRVRSKGSDKHFSTEHLHLFQALNDGQPHRVSEVVAAGSSAQTRLLGVGFLLELWEKGILVCV
jgi:hypothetical protein